MDLNFLVGNRREITFVLQARPPRAPCDAYEQNAKDGSAYRACPRSAHGVHKVCAWCAWAVRDRRAFCQLGQLQLRRWLLLALMLPARGSKRVVWYVQRQEATADGNGCLV